MIERFLNDLMTDPYLASRVFLAIFMFSVCIYIIVYSFLQARQIRILQQKVQTSVDPLISVLTFIYVFFQIALFVIAILFL